MKKSILSLSVASLFLFAGIAQAQPDGAGASEKAPEVKAEVAKKIEWCRLQHPEQVTAKVKTKSDDVYGQVFIPGCSEGEKVCKGVKAELGFGPKDALPTTFTYFPAKNNAKFRTDTNNDEYMAQLYSAKAGEFIMIYRFSLDDGITWEYCDFDDANGFDIAKAGKFIVTE